MLFRSTEAIKSRPSVETREDLEAVLAEQNEAILGLANLVVAMDERIKLLTALVDHDHQILIDHGWAPKRPAGGSLAN